MPLPPVLPLNSSPPLNLSTIGEYFGDTAPYTLTDYYRGGAYVPDVPDNSGVPTSGAISVLDFLGATRITVQLTTTFVGVNAMSPTDASVTYRVANDGTVKEIDNGGTTTHETWILDGAVGDYEVRFSSLSGTAPSGTLDTWLPLSSNQDITMTRTDDTSGTTSGHVWVEIRKAGEGSSMVIQDLDMQATVIV